ncbi:MAG: 50S ribosomal protein L15 [Omnitrophica WOR_2 bacterium RIFCSPHIGHO2_02_FULL_52_10]|nr:ribosomal protein L15 [uncultured bacterium]OGX34964.1 MAG: 50S ribosomal protein L15 [Omnitrophica WOR_2 bacterium RIFCSPHIGHO2_02_FULL_52_10]
MQLHDLKSPPGSRKRRKIVGRGSGSGHGKTCGRGEKGQNSRSTGRTLVDGLEGGQMPLIRRLPKVGFRSKRPVLNQVVDLGRLNRFKEGTVIDADFLKTHGLIKSLNKPFKIMGDGEIKRALVFHTERMSVSAREKVLKAGGKILKAVEPKEIDTDK